MSFATPQRERVRPALPLAAMVDILFLLLIFFMTASLYRERELQIPVALPTAESPQTVSTSATQIIISITNEGQIFVGERLVEREELQPLLSELAVQFPGESVVIRGDQNSRWGLAVEVMDIAQLAGIENIDVSTVRALEQPE